MLNQLVLLNAVGYQTTISSIVVVTGSFILLLVLIKKFAWEQIVEVFQKRADQINHDLDSAEESRVKAKKHEEIMMQRLSASQLEAATIVKDAKQEGHKALARLRLASVLMEQKAYPEALKQLEGNVPPEFVAAFADRKGDALVLQGDNKAAIVEYQKAYTALEARSSYRRVIEAKLNALGSKVQVAATSTTGNSQ